MSSFKYRVAVDRRAYEMRSVKESLAIIEKSDSEISRRIFHGGFEEIKENCAFTLFTG
jgi:hypothetical protein